MRLEIRRAADRVWLEGVQGWSFRHRRSSIHAAQEVLMRALGSETAYEYLVGVSGLAFRMQIGKTGFCPSSPHPSCGFSCVTRSAEALPWKMRILNKPEGSDFDRGIRQAIVESIDAGVPAQYGFEEDGVIAGYLKGGDEWLCFHPEHNEGATMFVEATLGWGVAIPTARKSEPPKRGLLAEGALKQAVQMAETDSAGGYFVGFRAWEEYIARLRQLSVCGEEASQETLFGSTWIYACLAEHRACAAKYLRDIESEFSRPARDRLIQAALLYQRMSDEVLTGSGPTPDLAEPLLALDTETSRFRSNQIQRLTEALSLEQEAVAAIKLALNERAQ